MEAGLLELGRLLGVSHKVGYLMSYWVLPVSCIPVSCTMVQQLTNLERQTQEWISKIKEFDGKLNKGFSAASSIGF